MRVHLTLSFQIDLTDWAIIYTARDNRVANKFLEMYREISRKVGMNVSKPHNIQIKSDNARTYCDEIKKLGKLQIVIIIFPSQRDDRYASVKKLCNVELGVPSQVSIQDKFFNSLIADAHLTFLREDDNRCI